MSPPLLPPPDPAPWPPPWARTLGFVLGCGLITWEAILEHSAHLFVYGIGFLMTGLPVARGLERLLDFISAWRK